jgi:hypothetical protein
MRILLAVLLTGLVIAGVTALIIVKMGKAH